MTTNTALPATDTGLSDRRQRQQLLDDLANDAIRLHHVLEMALSEGGNIPANVQAVIGLCADLAADLGHKIGEVAA